MGRCSTTFTSPNLKLFSKNGHIMESSVSLYSLDMTHSVTNVTQLKVNQMRFWHHMFVLSWVSLKRLIQRMFFLESTPVHTSFTVSWMCATLQACMPAPTKR